MARKLEAACVDAVFFADVHGVYDVYGGSWKPALRHAVQAPVVDPVLVVAALAAVTQHIGLVVTYSTAHHAPYECARLFSSLDHLSGGRVGWNIVTSYLRSASENGLGEFLSHDERYDRADEYVRVCRALWEDSWADDAVVRDAPSDTFTNADRVREIAHNGRWFRVRGPHQCEPSPQRTPVLYQAGASKRGTSFAARHAEVVFATVPDARTGAGQLNDLRRCAENAGRDPARLRMAQGAFVLTAATRADVRARAQQITELTSTSGELAKLSGWLGVDFAQFSDDTPLSEIPIEASRSIRDYLVRFDSEQVWTIGDVRSIATFSRRPHRRTGWLIGTPEQIADQIESFVEESGIDGFNLMPCPPTTGVDDICDLLVPELQRRALVRREYEPHPLTLRERYFGAGQVRYA
jgi:FMN-dependent oxidoreductase (nitrilotriacetate monooxygenase family)